MNVPLISDCRAAACRRAVAIIRCAARRLGDERRPYKSPKASGHWYHSSFGDPQLGHPVAENIIPPWRICRCVADELPVMLAARTRHRSSAQWPFWLLLAAWVCANSPQVAVHGVLGWLAEARNFSHQHRLTADVATLLGGEPSPAKTVTATTNSQPNLPPPALPADLVFKRLDLAVQDTGTFFSSAWRTHQWLVDLTLPPDSRRAPPLLGPPRVEPVA